MVGGNVAAVGEQIAAGINERGGGGGSSGHLCGPEQWRTGRRILSGSGAQHTAIAEADVSVAVVITLVQMVVIDFIELVFALDGDICRIA